jgi:hypothetical protein
MSMIIPGGIREDIGTIELNILDDSSR